MIAAIAMLALAGAAYAGPIVGQASAIDGDTIELAGQRIRLWGIDSPERSQTCEAGGWMLPSLPWQPMTYECGRDATASLAALLRGRSVSCAVKERDRYGRTVAMCSTEAGDLGAAMVRQGQAVDYARYSKGRYAAEQQAAKAEKLGIWSGRFEPPEQWRKARR